MESSLQQNPDLEIIKVVAELVNGKMFTNRPDLETEMSDLSITHIAYVTNLESIDRLLGKDYYHGITENFKRNSISKDRASRKEFFEFIGRAFQRREIEQMDIEKRSKIKQFFNRFTGGN